MNIEADPYGSDVTTLTATGTPCTFTTDLADALVSLTANIVCGGGTPSTPIPLVGHSELNLTRCGVNLCSSFTNGVATIWGGALYIKAELLPNTQYTFSFKGEEGNSIYSNDYLFTTSGTHTITSGTNSITLTTLSSLDKSDASIYDNDKGWIVFRNNVNEPNPHNFSEVMCELGSTPTSYEPYNGDTFTVAFGQTVYGGVYDKSGRLTITWAGVDLGSLNFNGSSGQFYALDLANTIKKGSYGDYDHLKCSIFKAVNVASLSNLNNYEMSVDINGYLQMRADDYSTDAEFETAMSGIILAYELATPIVIDVPSISVFAENGVNNIVSDCGGDVSATYIKKV